MREPASVAITSISVGGELTVYLGTQVDKRQLWQRNREPEPAQQQHLGVGQRQDQCQLSGHERDRPPQPS